MINQVKMDLFENIPEYFSDEDTRQEIYVSFAVKCAEKVLPFFETHMPGDERPRKAINAAKHFLINPDEADNDFIRNASGRSGKAASDAMRNSAALHAALCAADTSRAAFKASCDADDMVKEAANYAVEAIAAASGFDDDSSDIENVKHEACISQRSMLRDIMRSYQIKHIMAMIPLSGQQFIARDQVARGKRGHKTREIPIESRIKHHRNRELFPKAYSLIDVFLNEPIG